MPDVVDPPVRLRPPVNLVSGRARAYWTVRALPLWVVVGAIEAGALAGTGAPLAVWLPVVAISAVLAAAHLVIEPQWRYRVHRWEITDVAVYTQAGWFRQERRIAPMTRIQTVDTARGPLEQLFGLANVTVTTASARGPILVHALDVGVADRVVATLTEKARLDDGDGT